VSKSHCELQKGHVDYVILMSTNGVKYLFSAAENYKLARLLHEGLKNTFVIAVGPKTAESMKEYNVHVDMVPQQYSSEGLLKALEGKDLQGKKIRIPRTSNATPTLTDTLREMGADVEEIYVYESGLPMMRSSRKVLPGFDQWMHRRSCFLSRLSAKNIFKMLAEKAYMEKSSPINRAESNDGLLVPPPRNPGEMDIKVDVVPKDYLFESALYALAEYWNAQ
jgi:uroporphyrinogen-III synthase